MRGKLRKLLRHWYGWPVIASLALLGGTGVYAGLGGFTSPPLPINLENGLVANYTFSGNANDSSGNNYHGTVDGATLVADRQGNASSAYSFDGNDKITYSSLPSLTGGDFSISQWFKKSSTSSVPASFSQGIPSAWSGSLFILYIGDTNSGTNGGLRIWWDGASRITYTTSVADDVWHHVALTRSGANLTLYLDGNIVGTSSAASTNFTSTSSSTGAANNNGTFQQFYTGSLDEVRLYNRALNSNEVNYLHRGFGASGSARVQSSSAQKSLMAWWKMDGDLKDASGYYRTATGGSPSAIADRKGKTAGAMNYAPGSSSFTALDLTNTPFTITAWIYVNSFNTNTQAPIIGTSAAGVPSQNLHAGLRTGRIHFGLYSNDLQGTTVLSTGQWYHVAYVLDSGGTKRVYLNGQQDGGTHTGAMLTGNASRIGDSCCFGGTLNGALDDIRIYRRNLSAQEIKDIYDSYNATVTASSLQKGLIGHWSFNGDAKDKTPKYNHGTITGASLTADRRGRANSAYEFNGSSQYISLSGSMLPQQYLTVSAWVKQSNLANWYDLVRNSWCAAGGWQLYSNASGVPIFGISESGCVQHNAQCAASSLTTGSWYHLTGTYDGTTVRLYLNGQLCPTTNALSGQQLLTGSAWHIGEISGTGTSTHQIDDVRIWNRALSNTEVQALYDTYQ